MGFIAFRLHVRQHELCVEYNRNNTDYSDDKDEFDIIRYDPAELTVEW